MSKIVLMVPTGRRTCGRGALFGDDGRMSLGPFRILATANARIAAKHGNPERDPRLPFGHTPAGSYVVAGSLPPGYRHPHRPRRFGGGGALMLAPSAGVAAEAMTNGRRLMYLHAGPLDRRGRLRPTYGGLRVSEPTLAALLDAVNRAFMRGDPLASVEVIDVQGPPRKSMLPADRVGEGRPFLGGDGSEQALPTPPVVSPGHAMLILTGAGLLKERDGQAPADPARRRLIAGALMLLGGLTACGSAEEPSPCQPLACDPVDSWCPPSRYVCPGDVYVGWYTGGAGDTSGDTSGGGGDTSGDTSGGGG